ncbi:RNAPII transcription regulator C-terminal [Rhizoctonia solani]|uniref:MMS19 nucleotide excision repair protein n=1 Tax=Rhizoctonia solani TaxID=456999 RepID=A0A8H7IGY3_9AGAM|nr:RNAPII transcription regulator C-terminal [Rhizoctonia solani]
MEKCQELVRTYVATDGDDTIKELVQHVDDQLLTLLHIVKSLGEYLTSEDGKIREKGIRLLSHVISQCQSERISKQSTRVLTTFYLEKIQDADTIIPALDGLLTLTSLPTFGTNEATDTAHSVISHISMKALVQSVRYVVTRIKPHVPSGYIKLAEGEKDPRNLLLAFNIARVIALEFDITNHIDDLFDITFCYFPITFKPPPNDPYGITTEDLKSSLSPSVILREIVRDGWNTKRDTLRTISLCLPVYGPAVAKSFASQMWSAFKLEIFQPLDAETADKAVNALTTLLLVLGKNKTAGPGSTEEVIDELTEEVITECLRVLREPEKSQAQHAIKIVNACLDTASAICTYTLNRVAPFLIKQFHDPDEAAHRDPILAALRDVLHAIRELKEGPCREASLAFLKANKDTTLGALTSGLNTKVSRGSALSGLLQISYMQGVLSNEEMAFVVHKINELLGSEKDELEDLSGGKHSPMLFAALPDKAPARDADEERAKYWAILSALATLCEAPTLFEVLVIRLSTKLEIICGTGPADRECTAAYASALLQTISNVLARKSEAAHPDVPKYLDRLLPTLLTSVVTAAISPTPENEVATHPKIIHPSHQFLVWKQASFINSLSKLFYEARVEGVLMSKLPAQCNFNPFDENAPYEQRNVVILLTASIVPLRPETELPFEDLDQTLSSLVEWCTNDRTSDVQSINATRLISSLVNKHSERLKSWMDGYLPNFWQETIYNPRQVRQVRIRALQVWVAVTRALVVQSHQKGDECVNNVFSLSKIPCATIRLFALQKLCARLLPRVILGYKESKESLIQDAYLVALASLIKAVPKSTYAEYLSVLMPILLRGLSLEGTELRTNIFQTLLQVAKDTAELSATNTGPLAEHAGSLIKAALSNSQHSEAITPSIQVCALQLLAILPGALRYDILHPYKSEVIRKLGSALDDRKRAVRKEAVDCR